MGLIPTPVEDSAAKTDRVIPPIFQSQFIFGSTTYRLPTSLAFSGTLGGATVETSQTKGADDINAHLIKLSPVSRWKYLARHDTVSFIFVCGAVLAFVLSVLSYFGGSAIAQVAFITSAFASTAAAAVQQTEFQYGPWFLAAFGAILAWSLAMITFSQAQQKLEIARDTLKLVTGLLVGFFSGKVK